jgi:hypothetical protein
MSRPNGSPAAVAALSAQLRRLRAMEESDEVYQACLRSAETRYRRSHGLPPLPPEPEPAAVERECAACGSTFVPLRSWARFCSPRCKNQAGRARNTTAAEAA